MEKKDTSKQFRENCFNKLSLLLDIEHSNNLVTIKKVDINSDDAQNKRLHKKMQKIEKKLTKSVKSYDSNLNFLDDSVKQLVRGFGTNRVESLENLDYDSDSYESKFMTGFGVTHFGDLNEQFEVSLDDYLKIPNIKNYSFEEHKHLFH